MKYIANITWEATSAIPIDAANEDLALEKAMALGLPWRTAIEGDDSYYQIKIEPAESKEFHDELRCPCTRYRPRKGRGRIRAKRKTGGATSASTRRPERAVQ